MFFGDHSLVYPFIINKKSKLPQKISPFLQMGFLKKNKQQSFYSYKIQHLIISQN
tara:strand:- start:989 stop:1153 length:165 start_codon:yes stop_codon:yes gene_type:complete